MVLLFFALDLRSLSPPSLEEVKQCLLQLANLYALTPPLKWRNSDSSLEDRIGLCYVRRSAISCSDELKVAYSPRGKGFSVRDFHNAVNHLPSDSYSPFLLDDHGSFLFSGMDFSRLFSDEVLYSCGDKDIEKKIVLITSSLVGNMDSSSRKALLDAADRCVSMEFVLLEQKSSQLTDVSENIAKFREQICDLENCSFDAYLPDSQVFNGMVKRWYRELKDDTEEFLQAHFVFQRNISGSINQISCKLCCSTNQILDGFSPFQSCRCNDIPSDGKDGSKFKECLSCHVTKHDTEENTMKVGEHTLLTEASWRSWMNLCQISSSIDFNVLERTSLASLSEGVVVGRPYIVIPSVGQETDSVPEESDNCQLNNQLFHGLCRALYSLNQGLVCWSFCNIETMRQTALYYYYVLHPSDSGPMLLRRLAGAEEILPIPDVNLSDSLTAEEIDNSMQQCLQMVELRDYNPVQHSGGFHQEFNQLVEKSLQSGVVTSDRTTESDSTHSESVGIPLQSSLLRDIAAPEGETHPLNQTDEQDKGISCLTQEWEQLIVGNISRMDSLPSEPIVEKSKISPAASQRPLDTRTSKILERLGNPKQMKMKTTSPTQVSVIDVADQGLVTNNHLMKPTFHRLKRKYRSVKTFTYESLNNIVRLINGFSALLLAVLPGKANILEGIQGWELKPTFGGPRLPRWMGNGVSSFNQLIHELSVDSDTSSVEYSSGEEGSDGYSSAGSPRSQSSRVSWASSVTEHDKHWSLIGYIISWILFPVKLLFWLPFRLYHLLFPRGNRSPATRRPPHLRPPRKLQSLRDHFVHRTTDRRRGVIEDLHLATEIFIEAIFDAVYKAAHLVLSPSEAFRTLFGWASPHQGDPDFAESIHAHESAETVPTATLGDSEPVPAERKATFHPLNTDARTCQDVITELGYPYEAIHVVTDDGYILLLERMPRRDSRKAVYLQHGVLDSSMGWVSNGVVGSPAFAAFDQGYDVFLGNFRGLVSREHVDRNISSKQYWRYSINEHGTKDIPAMIEKIHEVKTSEMKLRDPDLDKEISEEQPYNLCAISHSLGGAGVIMYVITRLIEQKPHRLSRLILLSPAGFHDDSTFGFTIFEYVFLALAPILAKIVPAFYIPTRFFRMLLNKLARDFHNYPAVGGLVQTFMSYLVGGDSSNWVGVLGLPHYNMNDMPGVSFYVALHLAQMKRTGKFRMFDYGRPDANMEVYGCPEPLDLGAYFDLIDIPVDLVAGRKDRVIRPSMVRKYYHLMKEAGVEVSYNEYEYAHLDFTFSHREELLAYVMSRLQLVQSTPVRREGSDGETSKKELHEVLNDEE